MPALTQIPQAVPCCQVAGQQLAGKELNLIVKNRGSMSQYSSCGRALRQLRLFYGLWRMDITPGSGGGVSGGGEEEEGSEGQAGALGGVA